MQLYQKQKIFPHFFFDFHKFRINFEYFQEKDNPSSACIFELTESEKRGSINFEEVPFQKTL